jgi:ribosomal protein S13
VTKHQKLAAEVAHAETILREAAVRLLRWTEVVTAHRLESLTPEEIRMVTQALAKTEGRLRTARELTIRRKAK